MGSRYIYYILSGKVTRNQGFTSQWILHHARNILVRFGFITFCGNLPRGTSGYRESVLNVGSNFVARLESLKLDVNPYYEGYTFLKNIFFLIIDT